MIPANFWKRATISLDSTIGCLTVSLIVPTAFEADPLTSLIDFLGADLIPSLKVSNTS